MTAFFWILAIVGLALLIVVHEFGHFIVARLCGMRVERFSIGFGNPIFKVKRGDTIFQIAPIPLGGFVQITGMNPHEEFDANDPYVYPNRPRWMQLAVLVAGPFANYLTAVLLAIPFFLMVGVPGDATKVKGLIKDSPAAAAGFESGDVIKSANGQSIKQTTALVETVKASKGAPVTVVVERGGQSHTLEVRPKWSEEHKQYLMGVELEQVMRDASFGEAAVQSVVFPYKKSQEILAGLWNMVTRKVPANVAGPIGIARAMAAAAERGVLDFMSLIIMLSIYLGLFNLLPLPALDGGRVLFLGIQSLGLKSITAKREAMVHMVGLLLLLGVFVIVTFSDIRKVVTGEPDVATEAQQDAKKKQGANKPPAAAPAEAPAAAPEGQGREPAPASP